MSQFELIDETGASRFRGSQRPPGGGSQTINGGVPEDPIPVGAGGAAVVVTPDGTKLYSSNYDDDEITVIDPDTDTVLATIAVDCPGGLAFTPDSAKAYVAQKEQNKVIPITVSSGALGSPITVGADPVAVAITPDGTKAYVANGGATTVSVIDLATDTVTSTIDLATDNGPLALAITPDGTKAYVAAYPGNVVVPIDVATDVAGTPIPVGNAPSNVAFTPDGAKAYVGNSATTTVSVIDVDTDTVTGAITVGASPQSVSITPDGVKAYVVNEDDNTVSVVDVATDAVTATLDAGFDFNIPFYSAITPDGIKLYVNNVGASTLAVIDTRTDQLFLADLPLSRLTVGTTSIISGSELDPTTVTMTWAEVGSVYLRTSGELWWRTGSGLTDWSQAAATP